MTMGNDNISEDVWVYHERQEAALCGQHALNNLLQAPVFTPYQLSSIAQQLDELELAKFRESTDSTSQEDYRRRLAEGSHNVDAAGNFSIQVLQSALQNEYRIPLPCLTDTQLYNEQNTRDITAYNGFLCHKSDHWFAIRQVGGRFWNLNSMLEFPTPVGHFELAKNLREWRTQGYTIFIADGLPERSITSSASSNLNKNGVVCHRMDDLLKGKATQKNAWDSLQGAGRRLDGSSGNSSSNSTSIQHLSEEEQLAMALSASVADQQRQADTSTQTVVEVPPEPASGTPDAVRIQLKLPNGRKVVRRFLQQETVAVVEAFCVKELESDSNVGNNNRPVQVLASFPPKPLESSLTILDAKLANQSVQVRYKP